jgi:PKHD-type hydroxylase
MSPMILAVADVFTPADIAAIRKVVDRADFVDGRSTAGWSAKLVKDNLQAADCDEVAALRAFVGTRLLAHPVFALATRPKTIIGPQYSRYETGHAYGAHVDDALIGGVRTDVSFTLFLTDPGSYDGGELIIETSSGEEAFKLPAGSMVSYPSTTLHRVAPVNRGIRLAAVGWVRSFVRDPSRRELLYDLEAARRRLFEREGKTPEGDLLAKCAANLTRAWCDD